MRAPIMALFTALGLSSCATAVPDFDIPRDKGGPMVGTIVQEIECELDEIVRGEPMTQYLAAAHDVNVAILLNLDATDDGALAPTSSYLSGAFTLAGGASLEQSREQNFQEQLTYSLAARRAVVDNILNLPRSQICRLWNRAGHEPFGTSRS